MTMGGEDKQSYSSNDGIETAVLKGKRAYALRVPVSASPKSYKSGLQRQAWRVGWTMAMEAEIERVKAKEEEEIEKMVLEQKE